MLLIRWVVWLSSFHDVCLSFFLSKIGGLDHTVSKVISNPEELVPGVWIELQETG